MTEMSESLEQILGRELSERVREIPDQLKLLTPESVSGVEEELSELGAVSHPIGSSRGGVGINALVTEAPSSQTRRGRKKTMLLWGYPHPDEPLGASWLPLLARQHLAGRLGELSSWRIVIVLCADPDAAAMQSWMSGSETTLAEFSRGAFRPTHLSLEADYGFPLDWGPFLQTEDWVGRCRTIEECLLSPECATSSPRGPWRCSKAKLPPGPLGSSLALAEAMRRWPPDLVVSLHNTHTGGDYTFLLEREGGETLRRLQELPGLSGRGRHLGEPIDRGARWLRDEPDLLKEKTLERKKKRLEKLPGYSPGSCYAGNASAANFIEALPGRVQFCCPESTLFYHPDFSDRRELTETETVSRKISPGRKNTSEMYLYESVRGAGGEWVLARQERLSGRKRSRAAWEERAPVSRAACGIRALQQRRAALAAADEIWAELQSSEDAAALAPHLYYDERARMRAAAGAIGDSAALIFRTRADYAGPATVAQRASFEWLWPAHTASLLANFSSYLRAQPEGLRAVERAREDLDRLIRGEISDLPPGLQKAAPVGSAARSIAARVFLLAREISKRG